MEPLTIAATIGLLASISTAVTSLWRGIVKSQSEAVLVKRLRSDHEVQQRLVELQRKLQREEQDVSAVYNDYLRTLQRAVATLPESDRKRILEGLRQPSETGRSNYLLKLVQESRSATRQPV